MSTLRRSIPQCPSSFDGTLPEFFTACIVPALPEIETVYRIHQLLKEYCQAENQLMVLRYEQQHERGCFCVTNDGTIIRWSDNSPASAMHQAAYSDRSWTAQEFRHFIHNLPISVFERPLPINNAGYYVAHVFPVKPDRAKWRTLNKQEVVARFIRNVHPANHFYVPNPSKGVGARYGEDPAVIAYIATQYQRRYREIWTDFLSLAEARQPLLPSSDGIKIHFCREGCSDHAHKSPSSLASIAIHPQPAVDDLNDCFVQILPAELKANHREWTGNDKSQQRHHGVVSMNESPLDIRLAWKAAPNSATHLVGCYRLDLRRLLDRGFVRPEPHDSGCIRLQFVREGSNVYIRAKESGPRLLVGHFLDAATR